MSLQFKNLCVLQDCGSGTCTKFLSPHWLHQKKDGRHSFVHAAHLTQLCTKSTSYTALSNERILHSHFLLPHLHCFVQQAHLAQPLSAAQLTQMCTMSASCTDVYNERILHSHCLLPICTAVYNERILHGCVIIRAQLAQSLSAPHLHCFVQ